MYVHALNLTIISKKAHVLVWDETSDAWYLIHDGGRIQNVTDIADKLSRSRGPNIKGHGVSHDTDIECLFLMPLEYLNPQLGERGTYWTREEIEDMVDSRFNQYLVALAFCLLAIIIFRLVS